MNELQKFNSEEFGEIRTVTINNEPWFVASDICKALEIANTTQAVQRLDDDEKSMLNIGLSGGATNCVNEYGLYNLILASRKREAKQFKRWITHEVIPSIRSTGSYSAPQTTAGQIQLLAQGHIELVQKIDSVDKDLQEFKKEMPLLAIECQRIVEAKNKKVVPLLGGKNSNAYHNASLRGRVYRDLEGQLRREFGVSSYKAIKRNQTDKAVEIIRNYELPMCLENEILNENSQVSF